MRHAPLLLSVLFTLPLCGSIACSSKTESSSRSSDPHAGWTRGISIGRGSTNPYALGEHAHLDVVDQLTGPTECHKVDSGGCGGPTDSCTNPTVPTDSTVESVTCEGACLATAQPRAAGAFDVEVIARAPGPAKVVIRLRDRSGDVREATSTVRFERATHIGVLRSIGDSPHGTTYAALAGASFTWCSNIDADGAPLTYEPKNIGVTIVGATTQAAQGAPPKEGRCDSFLAIGPGTIDVAITYGDLVRHEKVRVVDASDVRAVELLEPGGALGGYADMGPIELDPLRGLHEAKAVDVAVDKCDGFGFPILQRLTLWDGTYALGQSTSVTVTPAELASSNGSPIDHATIAWFAPRTSGRGTIIADVGAGHIEVPLTVTGRCLPPPVDDSPDAGGSPDAGTDDAADAGVDENDDAGVP